MKTWKQKKEEAHEIWEGMKRLNPKMCEAAERIIKRRMKIVKALYGKPVN